MRTVTKRIIVCLYVLISFIVLTSCVNEENNSYNSINLTIEKSSEVLYINDVINFNSRIGVTRVTYVSSNPDVLEIKDRISSYYGIAKSMGYSIVTATSRNGETIGEWLITVKDDAPDSISISGSSSVIAGEITRLVATTTPNNENYKIIWQSTDASIATVTGDGIVRGVKQGYVSIIAKVEGYDVASEILLYVKEESYSSGEEINNQEENTTKTIELNSLKDVFEPVLMKAKSFIVGVNSYTRVFSTTSLQASATGVVYKRYCILADGSEVLDDGTITNFYGYKYYVITAKHIIEGAISVEVYYEDKTYDATVIAYDKKIDLGVITFTTDRYFSVAVFGDSNDVETGEFVLAVGNSYGSEYFDSATYGVVSYHSRYVATDTDGDGTNDWDSLYIQHDCAIGDGSSGGPLLNLKGEVIGINSKKINSAKIDNMGFAIPSNLTVELCSQLSQGIVPERPVFKISVLTVVDILKNEYLMNDYPIPEGITYGIYIAEVDKGGVGDKCGMKPGDIIVEFDGKKITYSYELRAAMGEVIIGSGEEINVVVYRNGEYITLKAVF